MLAFVNTTVTKPEIIAQLQAHADADEIIQCQYWENGKGCAVGCTIHSDDHAEYEPRFGIPQMLARLEDCIFEGLPNGAAKNWPIRFMTAINPGSDLSLVGWQFLHWLLTDRTVNPGIEHHLVRDAVKRCADIIARLAEGESVNVSAARSAESAAWSAAESAAGAARSAAWSAACAARSAESAAWSASWSAAASASESASWSAESASWSAAESAKRAAWSAAWSLMADKLIELIKAAQP